MKTNTPQPHVVVCPTSGMGNLAPFLRISSLLASSFNCKVTLVAMLPTISEAESDQITHFFNTHQHVNRLDFHIPASSCADTTADNPFFLQFEAINSSVHLLGSCLSALTPPISAIFSDLFITKGINEKLIQDLFVPNYTVVTTSARFFSLMANLPKLLSDSCSTGLSRMDKVEISGLDPLPKDSIPPFMFNPNHLFAQIMVSGCEWLHLSKGIIINTFDFFERETITNLKKGIVFSSLPPVYPVGPLRPNGMKGLSVQWLNDQPPQSVVFVCFGSHTILTREQIKELGIGLEKSGHRFLWVVKTSKVDKEDKEDLKQILGDEFFENTKSRGVVVDKWVVQEEILAHPSTGGFVSHCGWNSVMEAAYYGMPVLAWPQHGDQRVNAEVVKKAGLGIWDREWGWYEQTLVKGEEISDKIKELMENEKLRATASNVGKEARKACEVGGSSKESLEQIIQSF